MPGSAWWVVVVVISQTEPPYGVKHGTRSQVSANWTIHSGPYKSEPAAKAAADKANNQALGSGGTGPPSGGSGGSGGSEGTGKKPGNPIDEGKTRLGIVDFAVQQIGLPYVWGGDGPPQSAGYDCSGLTFESYLHNGVTLPRVASAQQAAGRKIGQAEIQPGDLVFAGLPAFHVAMFAGSGQVIAADHPGTNVRIRPFDPSEWSGGFRTYIAGGVVLTSDPLGGIPIIGPAITAGQQIAKIYELLGAIGKALSPKHLERIGKIGLGIAIIVIALIIMNRKQIEQRVESRVKTATEVAEVAAV